MANKQVKGDLTPVQICSIVDKEKSGRALLDQWWQDLAHYCIPHKATYTEEVSLGTKHRLHDVYDDTARDAVKVFAAGMMGYYSNPATQWYEVRISDLALMKRPEVKKFCKEASVLSNSTLNVSNFYQELYDSYLDLAVPGTTCMYDEDDEETLIRFSTRNIKEIHFFVDEKRRVVKVFRVFQLEAEQAFERWGEAAGEDVKKAMDGNNPTAKIDFIHCVYKRPVYDSRKADALNKPWASKWINVKYKKLVAEGGYMKNPFNIVTFQRNGSDKWGFSPAMDVEPSIRGANEIKRTMLRGGSKLVDPPMEVENDAYLLPLDIDAGGLNYRLKPLGTGTEGGVKFFQTGGNLPAGETMLEKEQTAIRKGFFNDLFMILNSMADKTRTAAEISARIEESMALLGPSLTVITTDLLTPKIITTVDKLITSGRLIVPAILKGKEYKIEYVSRLAKAQRYTENQSVQAFLMAVKGIAEFKPEALDKINIDEVVDLLADILGVDPRIFNDDKTIQDIRKARAEAQQQDREIALAQAQANTMKTGAQAGSEISKAQNKGVPKTK